MVLQQDTDVGIWGWAEGDEQITIAGDWLPDPVVLNADSDGHWKVAIPTTHAGGPHTLTISAGNSITLTDVLFGEVWVASGQSNMEMPLTPVSDAYTGIKDAANEIETAAFPNIRLFQVGNFSSKEPLDDVKSGIEMYGIPPARCQWQSCSPESIPQFASAAFFFARWLQQALEVPGGIIASAGGGASAAAWTPAEGLRNLGYTDEISEAATVAQQADQKIPTRLYNGMIHPLRHFTIRGAIWYQGESNAGRADRYQQLFGTMITQWRKAFAIEFPFYYVQIAPFDYQNVHAAYLREAQLETLALPGTGMAITMDVGNLTDIHPKNKQEVGRRLALLALAKTYCQDVVCSGPTFEEAEFVGGTARLRFSNTGGGLMTSDAEAPSHFEIAGADQVFHTAEATLSGDFVVVSSADELAPRAVRYAFISKAQPNLINTAGLPASSFRTDRW